MISPSRSCRVVLTALVIVIALASCTNPNEQKAQALYEKAKRYEKGRQLTQAVAAYKKIEEKYPRTRAAKLVRETVDFKMIEDALSIDRLKNVNEVKEHLKLIAKALETFYFNKGAYPLTLEELVPAYLQALPRDPWGARYTYGLVDAQNRIIEPTATGATGYIVAWFGKDRIPGGEGDDSDVFIRNGQFVQF